MSILSELYKDAFNGFENKRECKETDTEWSYRKEAGAVDISFQGSVSKIDWLQNFNFLPKKYHGIWYHRGFLKKWLSVKEEVLEIIDNSEDTFFTGFSQGGAVASVAAVDLGDKAVTFGQPRAIFSRNMQEYITAIVITKDIVHLLPPFYPKPNIARTLTGKYNIFSVYKNHMSYEELIDES